MGTAGEQPAARIPPDTIAAARDRRSTPPFQTRHFLDTMRGLFRWAAKAKHVKFDPTIGVEDPTMPKTEGFPIWTEEQVAAYEKRWPVGTRQRVWLDVLLDQTRRSPANGSQLSGPGGSKNHRGQCTRGTGVGRRLRLAY